MKNNNPGNFKKFLSYYYIYRRQFIPVIIAALISEAAVSLIPMYVQRTASVVINSDALGKSIIRLGIIMSALLIIHLVFGFFFDYYGHAMGAQMESDLRFELFSHLESLSFSFYDHTDTGTLMSSLTNDMLNLSELFHHGPEDYIICSIRMILVTVILYSINNKLLILLLLFAILMLISTLFWSKRLRIISHTNQERLAKINSNAADILYGIRTVQSYTAEEVEKSSFNNACKEFVISRKKIYRNESYADKSNIALSYSAVIALVIYGGFSVISGELDIAGLIAFIMYAEYLTGPIKKVSWMITQFQMGMAGFDRVMDLLNISPEITNSEKFESDESITGNVDMSNISFGYSPDKVILDNLSLRINSGELVAVVGTSGAGKSTLVSLIPRFYDIQKGKITIDGKDIKEFSLSSLRHYVTLVLQDTYLFNTTILENIRISNPDASDDEIRAAALLADAHGFIMNLKDGYNSVVGENGIQLSGGQRQRIGIARALIRNSPVLILDEATSALDSISEQKIYQMLKSRKNQTIIIIAHRLSTIYDSDRIIVLNNGSVCEEGTHDKLMALNGHYAALYSER